MGAEPGAVPGKIRYDQLVNFIHSVPKNQTPGPTFVPTGSKTVNSDPEPSLL